MTPAATSALVDRSGNQLERSPEHSLVTTTSLVLPAGSGEFDWLAEFDANYTSDRFVDSNNFTQIDSYWLFNLRLGLQGDEWSLIAFADNLFDDDTIKSGGSVAPDFGAGFSIPPTLIKSSQLPQPRVVGLRFNFSFGL